VIKKVCALYDYSQNIVCKHEDLDSYSRQSVYRHSNNIYPIKNINFEDSWPSDFHLFFIWSIRLHVGLKAENINIVITITESAGGTNYIIILCVWIFAVLVNGKFLAAQNLVNSNKLLSIMDAKVCGRILPQKRMGLIYYKGCTSSGGIYLYRMLLTTWVSAAAA